MDWSKVRKLLIKHNIPGYVITKLPDMLYSILCNEPKLDMFIFDNYLHEKYGDYEKENKTIDDLMHEIFNDDYMEACKLFN